MDYKDACKAYEKHLVHDDWFDYIMPERRFSTRRVFDGADRRNYLGAQHRGAWCGVFVLGGSILAWAVIIWLLQLAGINI
jgi:hypothetical protein